LQSLSSSSSSSQLVRKKKEEKRKRACYAHALFFYTSPFLISILNSSLSLSLSRDNSFGEDERFIVEKKKRVKNTDREKFSSRGGFEKPKLKKKEEEDKRAHTSFPLAFYRRACRRRKREVKTSVSSFFFFLFSLDIRDVRAGADAAKGRRRDGTTATAIGFVVIIIIATTTTRRWSSDEWRWTTTTE